MTFAEYQAALQLMKDRESREAARQELKRHGIKLPKEPTPSEIEMERHLRSWF